jgi:CHAD domain-containing protein
MVAQNLTLLERDKVSELVTLADYIYSAIQQQYIGIVTAEAQVLADESVSAIHQLRVNLRRLRSQIQAFSTILEIPATIGDNQIGKIARVLGKVRDLDVLKDNLKNYRTDLPESERSQLEQVTSAISKRRRKEILKVRSMFDAKDYQYFKLGINNWLNQPRYTPTAQLNCQEVLPDLLLSVICRFLLDAGWWLDGDLAGGDTPESAVSQLLLVHGDGLHDLRKQAKAVRYLMELFPDRYPPQYQDYLNEFKQVHQIFGNIQDNIVLDKFTRKVLGKQAATKLPKFYDRIASENWLNWQNWQPIRDRYRQPNTKQELKLLLIGIN